jgi:hypothetical protein
MIRNGGWFDPWEAWSRMKFCFHPDPGLVRCLRSRSFRLLLGAQARSHPSDGDSADGMGQTAASVWGGPYPLI